MGANFPGATNAVPGVYGPTWKDVWVYDLNLEKIDFFESIKENRGHSVRFEYNGDIIFTRFGEDMRHQWKTNEKDIWNLKREDLMMSNEFAEVIIYLMNDVKADQIVSR